MWVKSRRVDSVGFWEQNPAHPGGEVFVAGDAAVEVAETPAALSALANQLIERVDPPKPEAVESFSALEDEPWIEAHDGIVQYACWTGFQCS